MGYSCQLLKSSCWAYKGAATSTAAAMKDERIAEGVEKIIKKSCKVSETSSLAAPVGGVYRLQCSALQPRLQLLTQVPAWPAGASCCCHCRALLRLTEQSSVDCQLTTKRPAIGDGPEEDREERGQRLRGPGEGHGQDAGRPATRGTWNQGIVLYMIFSIFHTFIPFHSFSNKC